MQLSLPIPLPAYTEPAAPAANQGLSTPSAPTPDTAAPADDSFEHYLPKKETPDKATADKDTPDAEKMAAILAASLWMPVVPPPSAVPAGPTGTPATVKAMAPTGETPTAPGAVWNKLASAGFSSAGFTIAGPAAVPAGTVAPAAVAGKPASLPGEIPAPLAGDLKNNPEPGGLTTQRSPGFLAAPSARTFSSVVVTQAVAGVVTKVNGSQDAAKIPGDAPATAAGDSTALLTGENPVTAPASRPDVTGQLPQAYATNLPAVGTNPVPTIMKRAVTALSRTAAKNPPATDGADDAASVENSGVVAAGLNEGAATIPAPQAAFNGNGSAREKNAAGQPPFGDELPSGALVDKKDFLKAGHVTVTASAAGVGTGVARFDASMPAATANRSKSSPATEPGLMGTAAAGKPAGADLGVEAPAPVASLRETLAAVVSAVDALERGASAGQNKVELQFQVAGEHLSLHVELRDGTVHTTFRTNSSELRTALSQEWQSVVSPAGGRDVRLADPVFSSSSPGGQQSSFGSPGQGASQRQAQQTPDPGAFLFSPDPAETGAADPAPAAVLAAKSNQLLSVFA